MPTNIPEDAPEKPDLVPCDGTQAPRVPGSMKGEIWIAPDFDSLPADMAEAFGMSEPEPDRPTS